MEEGIQLVEEEEAVKGGPAATDWLAQAGSTIVLLSPVFYLPSPPPPPSPSVSFPERKAIIILHFLLFLERIRAHQPPPDQPITSQFLIRLFESDECV